MRLISTDDSSRRVRDPFYKGIDLGDWISYVLLSLAFTIVAAVLLAWSLIGVLASPFIGIWLGVSITRKVSRHLDFDRNIAYWRTVIAAEMRTKRLARLATTRRSPVAASMFTNDGQRLRRTSAIEADIFTTGDTTP